MFIFIKGNFSGLQLQASTEYGVKTCLFPGMHLIEVLYDDAPVPKSPFRVSVVEGCDRSNSGTCLWTRSGGRSNQQAQLLHCGDKVPVEQ